MTRIVFMGTPDFAVPVLRQLLSGGYDVIAVVTQPDRPKGRKKVMTPPPVKVEAEKHEIPVFQPEKIKEKEEYEKIIALNPDLIVTAAFGQILPEALLKAPTYGCINVHASLLPKLRGGAPIHYAILEGHEKTGVTIMYMVKQLDAGDMISKVEVPIEEKDHVGTLHDKLSAAGAKLLSETILDLLNGNIQPEKQKEEEATFAPNIKREMEKIDWMKNGRSIYNQIRGLHPWPVAYTVFEGKNLKVWWGTPVAGRKEAEPGTVVEVEEDGIVVATGDDIYIKITELQPAGKKRMDAAQFLRGAGSELKPGVKLGD